MNEHPRFYTNCLVAIICATLVFGSGIWVSVWADDRSNARGVHLRETKVAACKSIPDVAAQALCIRDA